MYGSQFHPTRQNDTNFLTSDSDSKQHQWITSRSLSGHVLQERIGTEHQEKTSDKSVPSGGFDLFGGQQQINHQPSMLRPTLHQHPGLNDVQHQQHQLMIRKMQELETQQQFRQLDLRQQNPVNQIPTFSKQASGSHSSNLINGNTVSGSLQYPWTTDNGTNWLNHDSSTMKGSSSGLVFPSNLGQTQHFVDLMPQQLDQSLYGVPISSAGGLALNQHSHKVMDRSYLLRAGDNLHGDHILLPEQVAVLDRTSISSHELENMSRNASSLSLNTETVNIGGFQQVGSFQRNGPQDFLGRRELTTGSNIPNEKSAGQVVPLSNESALDPAEEKILFGSDDNIWAAFGTGHVGESGNLFDNADLNGIPSIQSGSWSALMQSAVAEISRCDEGQQEWSGMMINNDDGSSVNQSSTRNDNAARKSLLDNDMQLHAALSPSSLPLPNDDDTNDAVGLNLSRHKFLNEPDRTPTEISCRFVSLEESSKRSNCVALQKSVFEGIQLYGNTSQISLEAERNAAKISPPWIHGHNVAQHSSYSRNSSEASGLDRLLNAHKDERLPRNVIQGSNVTKATSILNDKPPVANSSIVGGGDEVDPFSQNNIYLNQWKNINGYSQGSETKGRMLPQAIEHNRSLDTMNAHAKSEVSCHEMDNSDVKENSNDSHHSNLSWNASGGFKDTGLSKSIDVRSLPAKQKSSNQLPRNVSARKFQYHPMGKLDEDVEASYCVNQPNHMQAISQQNPHLDQSNFLAQFTRNSKGQSSDLQKHTKVSDEDPLLGVATHAVNSFAPFRRQFDLYAQDEASSPGQNMLELLPKVYRSMDPVDMVPLSSESNVPAQLAEAVKYDGSANNYQQNRLSVNQCFGLQLGPPSQQHIQDQDCFNLMSNSHSATDLEERVQLPTSVDPSSCLPDFEYQRDLNNKGSAFSIPHHSGNEKMHENFLSTFNSGSPCMNPCPSQQVNVLNRKMMNSHIDSSFNSMQRGSADAVLLDSHAHVEKSTLVKSHDVSQQIAPNDAQQQDPSLVLSAKDFEHTSQQFNMCDSFHQGGPVNLLQNTGTSIPARQHDSGVQYQNAASGLSSELTQPSIVESRFLIPENDMNGCKGSNAPPISPGGDCNEQRFDGSSGLSSSSVQQDPVSKLEDIFVKTSTLNSSDNSPAMMALTNIQIESLGQSLKFNGIFHQNLGLPSQVNDVKDSETGPSIKVSKRMKGPDHVSNIDLVSSNKGQKAEDLLSSSKNVELQEIIAQDVNFCYNNSFTDHTSSSRADYPEVSPHMAQSWFNQYETVKNGQMLNKYDAHEIPMTPEELPVTTEKSVGATDLISSETDDCTTDASQIGTNQASVPTQVPFENFSPHSSLLNSNNQELLVLGSKKRKSDTSDLHPWHKDILDCSQNLWALSVAEADWNKLTSCLAEKIDYDAEIIEDGPPLLKSKRRLLLTTQLMQLLFRPPLANILSSDASSTYESIVCAVSRTVLGDVCSMVSRFCGPSLPRDGVKLLAKDQTSGRKGDRFSSKIIEEFMGRLLKLENNLLRLDKNSSVFDLRMECQDLDKFSDINRLAKFHGRGSSESAEAAFTQKPLPQRYVTALPMPRTLPDRVQCLSL